MIIQRLDITSDKFLLQRFVPWALIKDSTMKLTNILNIRLIAKMYVCTLGVIKDEHSLNVLGKNIHN